MTNLYYNTVKQVLERASSVMIDREAIQHLTSLVKEVNKLICHFKLNQTNYFIISN